MPKINFGLPIAILLGTVAVAVGGFFAVTDFPTTTGRKVEEKIEQPAPVPAVQPPTEPDTQKETKSPEQIVEGLDVSIEKTRKGWKISVDGRIIETANDNPSNGELRAKLRKKGLFRTYPELDSEGFGILGDKLRGLILTEKERIRAEKEAKQPKEEVLPAPAVEHVEQPAPVIAPPEAPKPAAEEKRPDTPKPKVRPKKDSKPKIEPKKPRKVQPGEEPMDDLLKDFGFDMRERTRHLAQVMQTRMKAKAAPPRKPFIRRTA